MLFSTPTQFAVLALCLIAGWIFGLASAPWGKKWKARYRDEHERHAQYRRETEQRIHELEAERDRALKGAPAAAAAGTAAAAAPAHRGIGGWFGWGRDNLSRIKGIDEALEKQLNADGIKTYAAIEALTTEEEAALEERLSLGRGRIAREEWREQATMLREGRDDEHAGRWG